MDDHGVVSIGVGLPQGHPLLVLAGDHNAPEPDFLKAVSTDRNVTRVCLELVEHLVDATEQRGTPRISFEPRQAGVRLFVEPKFGHPLEATTLP